MAITHTIASTWSAGGQNSVSGSVTTTSDNESNDSTSVAASASNAPILVAFPKAKLKSLFVMSNAAITLKFSTSAATPNNTALGSDLVLAANTPYLFIASAGGTNPFASDVAAIFATNAGTKAAQVDVRALFSNS